MSFLMVSLGFAFSIFDFVVSLDIALFISKVVLHCVYGEVFQPVAVAPKASIRTFDFN